MVHFIYEKQLIRPIKIMLNNCRLELARKKDFDAESKPYQDENLNYDSNFNINRMQKQFNNPYFKGNPQPFSNFQTEPLVLNSNNYDRIFTSEDDMSSRMNDSIFNTFDNNRNEFNRKPEDISITQVLDLRKYEFLRNDESFADQSLLGLFQNIQKSTTIDKINVGMQQLDFLYNKIADVSDMSKMALTNHNPSETNKHLTYTIGEDDLKDELRDQVPELYPNQENLFPPQLIARENQQVSKVEVVEKVSERPSFSDSSENNSKIRYSSQSSYKKDVNEIINSYSKIPQPSRSKDDLTSQIERIQQKYQKVPLCQDEPSKMQSDNQFSIVSVPQYSHNISQNKFETINVSTNEKQEEKSNLFQVEYINQKDQSGISQIDFLQTFNIVSPKEVQQPSVVPLQSPLQSNSSNSQNDLSSEKNITQKGKKFTKKLFEVAENNIAKRTKLRQWQKRPQPQEIQVFCVNCEEFIRFEQADEHSKTCLAEKQCEETFDQVTEQIVEINRKLISIKNNLMSQIQFIDSSCEELDLIEKIALNNTNFKHLNDAIQKLQAIFTQQEQKLIKSKYSQLLLVRRSILLSIDKAEKMSTLSSEELEQAFTNDENESELQSELSTIEKMALQEKANMELWKQQHEMMMMVKEQDLQNLRFLKAEYLNQHKDLELISQITSGVERTQQENRSQFQATNSMMSDLHYQNNIDQVYNGLNVKEAENAPGQDGKKIFYNLAVCAKLHLPPNSKGKNLLIQDIYEEAILLKIPNETWEQFIELKFKQFQ